MIKDFCPLCATRFSGNTEDEILNKIIDHADSGYCQVHFVKPAIALAIDCYEKAFGDEYQLGQCKGKLE